MNVVADGNSLQHLHYLLLFLASWEKRPACLTPMAYQWCSAISEVVGRLGREGIPIRGPDPLHLEFQPRRGPQRGNWTPWIEFSKAGPGCYPARSDHTFHSAHGRPLNLTLDSLLPNHLPIILEIGFRPVRPGYDQPALHLAHTPHHDWVFEAAFSSDDDEVIADAVCVWVAGGSQTPPGSCARYFSKRVEKGTPFSQRLRRVSIHAIGRIWRSELEVSGLETVRLLNCLEVGVDDVDDLDDVDVGEWCMLLVGVLCSPAGLGGLSLCYWRLLEKMSPRIWWTMDCEPRTVEVARSLEEAEDWEKLEIWMLAAWRTGLLPLSEDVERVTLNLLLRRPSVLPRFEACETEIVNPDQKAEFRRICNQARTEQSPLEYPPPYVSVCLAQQVSVLMPLAFFASVNRFTFSHPSPFLFQETILSRFVYCRYR